MKIPIKGTIVNTCRAMYSSLRNFFRLPYLILLGIPLVIPPLLGRINSGGNKFDVINIIILGLTYLLSWFVACIFSAQSQRHIITKIKPNTFFEILPSISQREIRYCLYSIYLTIYIYWAPALLIGISFIFAGGEPIIPILIGITLILIAAFYSMRFLLVAPFLACYENNYSFRELMRASKSTLKCNLFRVFFIPSFMGISFGLVVGVVGAVGRYLGPYNSVYIPYIEGGIELLKNYIFIILTSSCAAQIYIFFEKDFEAKLAKIKNPQIEDKAL